MPSACFSGLYLQLLDDFVKFLSECLCHIESIIPCVHSGIFGERLPLRYYLSFGMLMSGLFTCLFGLGFYWNIHSLWYYAVIQVKIQQAAAHTNRFCSLTGCKQPGGNLLSGCFLCNLASIFPDRTTAYSKITLVEKRGKQIPYKLTHHKNLSHSNTHWLDLAGCSAL